MSTSQTQRPRNEPGAPKAPKPNNVKSNHDVAFGLSRAYAIGTAIGGACGAFTGAMLGSGMGAMATVVIGTLGILIGALAGGMVGRSISESSQPAADEPYWDAYWRRAYLKEPYFAKGRVYEDFAFAYRLGFTARLNDAARTWEHTEPGLKSQWENANLRTRIGWDVASQAANAAWSRVGYQMTEVRKDNDWSR